MPGAAARPKLGTSPGNACTKAGAALLSATSIRTNERVCARITTRPCDFEARTTPFTRRVVITSVSRAGGHATLHESKDSD